MRFLSHHSGVGLVRERFCGWHEECAENYPESQYTTASKSTHTGRRLENEVAEPLNIGKMKKAKKQDLSWQQKEPTEGGPRIPDLISSHNGHVNTAIQH